MKKNVNGFRLNQNGKPILNEEGHQSYFTDHGAMYQDNGRWYFFLRKQNGKFIYST
jgi:hypothetical protein